MTTEELLKTHYKNLQQIAYRFRVKHSLPYYEEFKITDAYIFFGDYYIFNIYDILFDLESKQPKGDILKWYESKEKLEKNINFNSYQMGYRIGVVEDLKEKDNKKRFLEFLFNRL